MRRGDCILLARQWLCLVGLLLLQVLQEGGLKVPVDARVGEGAQEGNDHGLSEGGAPRLRCQLANHIKNGP